MNFDPLFPHSYNVNVISNLFTLHSLNQVLHSKFPKRIISSCHMIWSEDEYQNIR